TAEHVDIAVHIISIIVLTEMTSYYRAPRHASSPAPSQWNRAWWNRQRSSAAGWFRRIKLRTHAGERFAPALQSPQRLIQSSNDFGRITGVEADPVCRRADP